MNRPASNRKRHRHPEKKGLLLLPQFQTLSWVSLPKKYGFCDSINKLRFKTVSHEGEALGEGARLAQGLQPLQAAKEG